MDEWMNELMNMHKPVRTLEGSLKSGAVWNTYKSWASAGAS